MKLDSLIFLFLLYEYTNEGPSCHHAQNAWGKENVQFRDESNPFEDLSLSLSLSNGDFVIITELLTGLVLFLLLLLHCVYTVVN